MWIEFWKISIIQDFPQWHSQDLHFEKKNKNEYFSRTSRKKNLVEILGVFHTKFQSKILDFLKDFLKKIPQGFRGRKSWIWMPNRFFNIFKTSCWMCKLLEDIFVKNFLAKCSWESIPQNFPDIWTGHLHNIL